MLKKLMKNSLIILCLFSYFLSLTGLEIKSNFHKNLGIWFNEPSNSMKQDGTNPSQDDPEWIKSLPIGNGMLGAMVFGDVNKERIQLNEKTLWSGSPQDANNLESSKYLSKIRNYLFKNDFKSADSLTKQTQINKFKNNSRSGQGANLQFGCFQTLGDLFLDFNRNDDYKNYKKKLDFDEAIVKVSYIQENVIYNREVFTSHKENVLIVYLTANESSKISFSATLNRRERFYISSKNNYIMMKGQLDNGNGGKGMQYMVKLKIKIVNGSLKIENNKFIITNASQAVLYLSAGTDYLPIYPNFKGNNFENQIDLNLNKVYNLSYQEIRQSHVNEYQKLYNRVSLFLKEEEEDLIPTNIRLENYKQNSTDLYLEQLIFQFGRYLLISSSHPNSILPANLQGIWANKIQTPWNGDYHTDINVQMNYWLAEVTNLAETHEPLIRFIEMLVIPGRITAKEQYNARGWCLHVLTNIWGFTSPGEDPSWGLTLGLTAWMCQHLWEHYLFNLNKEYLNRVFPIMLEAGVFYLDWLVVDPKSGKLVSGPTSSPENTFIAPDHTITSISMGSSHDQETIYNLFSNILQAAKILDFSNSTINEIKSAKERLLIPSIGFDGRIMEWYFPYGETDPGHRHMSHLWGLYPGNQFNENTSPELYKAAQKSLEFRLAHSGGSTGWSSAWTISLWARLKNGDKAREGLQKNLKSYTSYNLFDECPPFQIDGNFGNSAGVAEMLIQTHLGYIEILPALPFAWKDGVVKGLKGRGGFEIDIRWKEHEILIVKITSKYKNSIQIKWKNYYITEQFEEEEIKIFDKKDFIL